METQELSVHEYLKHSGRKMYIVRGDGSCLFRTISYELFNTEEHHFTVRNNLVWIISCNRAKFSKFLLPVNSPTIDEHIKIMSQPHIWGTHLEILAASTLLQIPVYTCRTNGLHHPWEVSRPIPAELVRFPRVVDETFKERDHIDHIELLYHQESHYDAIFCSRTGRPPTSEPQLTGTKDYIDLSVE